MIFSLGTILRTCLQVVDEPVLRGDGAGTAVGLVLVVVHQQQAVGVVGDELQVEVVVADGSVDVEAQIARLEVGVERGDQRVVAGLRVGRNLLEVEREAAIAGVGGEEACRPAGGSWRARRRLSRKSPIEGMKMPLTGS